MSLVPANGEVRIAQFQGDVKRTPRARPTECSERPGRYRPQAREEERREHLWFLESMDRINRAMQRTNDVEGMMSGVLEETLAIFGCDRAWLVYPCDPDAATTRVVMEHTRPEYPAPSRSAKSFPGTRRRRSSCGACWTVQGRRN